MHKCAILIQNALLLQGNPFTITDACILGAMRIEDFGYNMVLIDSGISDRL